MHARFARRLSLAASALAILTGMPRGASAQFGFGGGNPAASSTAPMAATGLYGNPYSNPYLNPFLNPAMSQVTQAGPANAALYFMAAQQASGGIGSGQLSGVRPGPMTPGRGAGAAARTRAGSNAQASASPIRTSDVPGAGAASYFGRSQKAASGTGPYYNRPSSYYSKNIH